MILYKYLSPERVDVIANARIRYTQPRAFNDPFEARPYVSALAHPSELSALIKEVVAEEKAGMWDRLPEWIRMRIGERGYEQVIRETEAIGPAIIEKQTPNLLPALLEVLDAKLLDHIGILSLSELRNSILMWAHYADSHRGFVIGFDSGDSYFSQRRTDVDEFHYLRQVEYRIERPQLPLYGLSASDMFLVKSSDWAYEKEWRILAPLREASDTEGTIPFPIHLFDFPPCAIREVILGSRMTKRDGDLIKGALSSKTLLKKVALLQAKVDKREFKVIFDAIST